MLLQLLQNLNQTHFRGGSQSNHEKDSVQQHKQNSRPKQCWKQTAIV